jgi:hypothetical protein
MSQHQSFIAFDLPPMQRHWLISPLPSLPHRLLGPNIWLPADRIHDIEMYSVNGHPSEAGYRNLMMLRACVSAQIAMASYDGKCAA